MACLLKPEQKSPQSEAVTRGVVLEVYVSLEKKKKKNPLIKLVTQHRCDFCFILGLRDNEGMSLVH